MILAAGRSRRFGSDKRLYPLDGTALLTRTLGVYRGVFEHVGAVIRPGEPDIARLVRNADCVPILAPDADSGQSRSLAAGVAAFHNESGVVIGLGDMPFVAAATLRALLAEMAAWREHIVRPRHADQPGNPVGFPARTFSALQRIAGDAGAKGVVLADRRVRYLDVDDPGILADVDTAADVSAPS